MKVANLLIHCPECGHKADLYEVSFYGYRFPKFRVECPQCSMRTPFYDETRKAVAAWNRGRVMKKRTDCRDFDNDAIVSMLSRIMRTVNEDYQRVASKEYLTKADKMQIQSMEEFVMENPYMLPYDRGYVLEEMRRIAKKANETPRKKHVS